MYSLAALISVSFFTTSIITSQAGCSFTDSSSLCQITLYSLESRSYSRNVSLSFYLLLHVCTQTSQCISTVISQCLYVHFLLHLHSRDQPGWMPERACVTQWLQVYHCSIYPSVLDRIQDTEQLSVMEIRHTDSQRGSSTETTDHEARDKVGNCISRYFVVTFARRERKYCSLW